MKSLYRKTGDQIKKQMYHWFGDYHSRPINEFTGIDLFTLFERMPFQLQTEFAEK